MSRQRVSLVMIVRNEEANLAACLAPVRHLFDEMIVVDTGSRDRTREIAGEQGATVHEFLWCDDFAAARNEALRHATGEWVFWLDADDRVDSENLPRLRQLLEGVRDGRACYVMNTRCLAAEGAGSPTLISHVRLFPRLPEVFWQGRVHEQILPSLERAGCAMHFADVTIDHVGYIDVTAARRKQNRDLRLLRIDYAMNPNDPVVLYNLGMAYMRVGDQAQAVIHLRQALMLTQQLRADWVRKLFDTAARAYRHFSDVASATTILEHGLARFPNDQDLLLQMADLRLEQDQYDEAEKYYRRLCYGDETRYLMFNSTENLRRRDGRRGLAHVYTFQGRHELAEQLFQEMLAEFPDDMAGWVWLAYLYLAMRHFKKFDYALRQMSKLPNGSIYAAVLEAERYRKERLFDQARQWVERAIEAAPRMAWAREILAEILVEAGAPQELCLSAWRDVLLLAPLMIRAQRMVALLSATHTVSTTGVPVAELIKIDTSPAKAAEYSAA